MPDAHDVIVVGGGPAGLTLAITLGQRGIRTLLLEKNTEPGPWPKMERCNARSMEIFRRLGLAERIRAVGFPAEIPMDVFIVAGMKQAPILRLPFDSVAEARAKIAATDDGSMPLEPYQLVSQYELEPVLKAEAEAIPAIDVKFGHEMIGFDQDGDGVAVRVCAPDGTEQVFTGRYLVGCDGGSSPVRKALGIKLEGQGRLQRLSQVQFRSENLFDRIPMGQGRHYYLAGGSSIIVQGNRQDFTLQSSLPADSDFVAEIRRIIPFDFDFEVLRVNSWNLNLLVAERYRDGHVFLVGDAAHLVIPNGGLGMNTAVGDASDIAWKLAAVVAGWGGSGLLDAYEEERRPVAQFNMAASRYATQGLRIWRGAVTPAVFAEGETGIAARIEIARLAAFYQKRAHEMNGAELGYHYGGSSIVSRAEDPAPPWEIGVYLPSTRPGARLPHMWTQDGRAIFDLIGPVFTLLNLGGGVNLAAVEHSFAARGIPLAVLHLDERKLRHIYGKNLILVRPDLHVAWRGDDLPADPDGLVELASGQGTLPPSRV